MIDSYPIADAKPGAIDFLKVPIHPVRGPEEVHQYICKVIQSGQKAILYNLNIHAFNISFKEPWFLEFIQKTNLVFIDGDGVRWGLKLLGQAPPPKMSTTRWIWQLAEFCAQNGYSLFLLGAKPGTAEAAAKCLQNKFPGLRIAGTQDGYFQKTGDENERVVAKINSVKPDILLTCFGMPAQEKWISENWNKIHAHIFIKGGAVMDYVTGRLGEAPKWILKIQMEWLFRVFEEPYRLLGRYLHDIPCFFYHVLCEKFRGRST
ncbi:MAG: WecB/TagA/CpsF family glycosyltransferase [Candidatus Omnitrophica bacterium]|nr:WecB/TagA/CpsF family glycosyltransferase [Candidatus Omnitrophota bacterium]